MKTIRSCFIFLLTFYIPSILHAQEEIVPGMGSYLLPVPGYVILSNGDTLYGELKWALKYVENNPVEIKFKAENGATKSLRAFEIKGFGMQPQTWMEDNPVPVSLPPEHYCSVPSLKKGEPVFMHRLIEGRITVYQNRSAAILSSSVVEEETHIDGIGFSFTLDNGLTIGPRYRTEYKIIEGRSRFSSYIVTKDGEPLSKINNDSYGDFLKTLMDDCHAVEAEIAKNPDLVKFKYFTILVEVYNELCKNQ